MSESTGPSGFRVRLRVSLRRWRLDRQLADGWDPDVSADRALRAGQLTDFVTRRRLARSLRGVVAAADSPRAALLGSAVLVCREAVVASREGLLGLADRLAQRRRLVGRGRAGAVPAACLGVSKLMKLDSGHVAWTCRRCGALAITGDLAVRPA
ncbi:MAG: hypothetical protein ACLP8S_34465 [Solirubrobacteraceae bacterium]|jgi:hypothetical protein